MLPGTMIFMTSQPVVMKIIEIQKQNDKVENKIRPSGAFCLPVVHSDAVLIDAAIKASLNR